MPGTELPETRVAPLPGSNESEIVTAFPPAAIPASTSDTPDVTSAPFHPYTVSSEIERGGMGAVYAAHDPVFDREVAIKVMLPGQDAARFLVEARVTARLPHPGVPPVYALGTLPDERPFLVMKLIRGHTLAAALQIADRPALLGAFERICQTVGFAHSQGIIHRDLKPSNVMVGDFGEVLVMDWGLAKETRPGAHEVETDGAAPPAVAAETLAGQGTPAYMAPEQARGEPVDARADVFALGGILAAVLTRKPPFVGTDANDTWFMACLAELTACFARLDACGADAELVALAKRCLAANAADRFANGQEVAAAVGAYRAGVEARLQQAERDRAVSAAEAREQRKRRHVQLTLAGVVLLVAIGGGFATNWVQGKRANDRIAAEEKRQTDLRAVGDEAQAKQRQTRADVLVQALESANTAEVPRLIDDLAEYRDLTGTKLQELAGHPVTTKPVLHARMALLSEEPDRATELAAYLPVCKPEELPPIVQVLKPHAVAVAPGLWTLLTGDKADAGQRVRAACALATLAPDDLRWVVVAPAVVEFVVKENQLSVDVWARALEPVRAVLLPKLLERYPAVQNRIRGGNLDESALAAEMLAAEVRANELTANLLARYAADRPAELAELAIIADPRHCKLIAGALNANKAGVVPVLKAELTKAALPPWAGTGEIVLALAAVAGAPAVADLLNADHRIDAQAKRRGYAVAVLLTLGEVESVWPTFAFPKDGDPSARSYLLERLAAIGADPLALVRRFEAEGDVSAKRALLIALGDYPAELVPVDEREPFVKELLVRYRDDPDSGLHSAIDWLLRQRWGRAKELEVFDAELKARALADAARLIGRVEGPPLQAPRVAVGKNWFMNGQGQTYAVVRAPVKFTMGSGVVRAVEFTMGSPMTEPGRVPQNEPAHRKRIPRTFALATREVTVEQFLRFEEKHEWLKNYSPGPDTPMVSVSWFLAVRYCNWLSKQEGIPQEQWCYAPNKDHKYAEGMTMKANHLSLTGYRLPTEAEWEYGCRSGAVTAWHFGRGR